MKEKKKEIKKAKKDKVIKKEKVIKDKSNKKTRKVQIKNTLSKIIEVIRKKWLIDGTKTTVLILIIIAAFIGINIGMQKLEITPLDFSQEKLYSLTDASKDKVRNIDKDVNIYFVGYTNDNATLDLAKQYNKVNKKIVAEAVDATSRPDLVEKYGIESGSEGIIVECGDKSKVLTAQDLVTYDMTTYETISIAEEKLTSSIQTVASDKIPKVYFLEGYSEFSVNQNMYYLTVYMGNEITQIETLDILTTGKVPDDCDTLVITTPSKDFDDIATNAILNYINSGKNLLWLNAAVSTEKNLPNVNKILATYGVKPFEMGIIRETDTSRMLTGSPDVIMPEVQYSGVTKNLYNTNGVIVVNATKINVDEENLENLNVTKTDLLLASGASYFRTNFNIQTDGANEGEETGTFLVGAGLEKTIKEANEETGETKESSKLIIYGENYFITDYQLSQNSQYGAIQLGYNKDLVLNSIAYLVDREEDITARKSTGTVTYTATEQQDTIIRIIIFIVPALIIVVGIIIWQKRRRKK